MAPAVFGSDNHELVVSCAKIKPRRMHKLELYVKIVEVSSGGCNRTSWTVSNVLRGVACPWLSLVKRIHSSIVAGCYNIGLDTISIVL